MTNDRTPNHKSLDAARERAIERSFELLFEEAIGGRKAPSAPEELLVAAREADEECGDTVHSPVSAESGSALFPENESLEAERRFVVKAGMRRRSGLVAAAAMVVAGFGLLWWSALYPENGTRQSDPMIAERPDPTDMGRLAWTGERGVVAPPSARLVAVASEDAGEVKRLEEGWAFVDTGATGLVVGGEFVRPAQGGRLVALAGGRLPGPTEREEMSKQLSIMGITLNEKEQTMFINERNWMVRGGAALCLLAGSVAMNDAIVIADGDDGGASTGYFVRVKGTGLRIGTIIQEDDFSGVPTHTVSSADDLKKIPEETKAIRCANVSDEVLGAAARLPGITHLSIVWSMFADSERPQITDAGLSRLREMASLEVLKLKGLEAVSGEGLAVLGALSKLKSLTIHACPAIDDDAMRHVAAARGLEHLDLAAQGPSTAFYSFSAGKTENAPPSGEKKDDGQKKAQELELPGFGFGDDDDGDDDDNDGDDDDDAETKNKKAGDVQESVSGEMRVNEVEYISKAAPPLTDRALSWINSLGSLKTLNLSGSAVTDAGLAQLERLSALEELNLRACLKVTAKGIEALQERLPKCKIAAPVYRFTRILPLGEVRSREDIEKLDEKRSVVAGVGLKDDDLPSLRRVAETLEELDLSRSPDITDNGLASLTALRKLKELNLGFNPRTRIIHAEGGMDGVDVVKTPAEPGVTDLGLGHISLLENLESLSLENQSKLTDAGVAILARLRNLRHLTLAGCSALTEEGIKRLKELLPKGCEMNLTLSQAFYADDDDVGFLHLGKTLRLKLEEKKDADSDDAKDDDEDGDDEDSGFGIEETPKKADEAKPAPKDAAPADKRDASGDAQTPGEGSEKKKESGK